MTLGKKKGENYERMVLEIYIYIINSCLSLVLADIFGLSPKNSKQLFDRKRKQNSKQ